MASPKRDFLAITDLRRDEVLQLFDDPDLASAAVTRAAGEGVFREEKWESWDAFEARYG